MADLDSLIEEARGMNILGHVRAIDVHCPQCGTRLQSHGECTSCGVVGSSEDELRRLDRTTATDLLQRSIARRRSWTPEKRGAKSLDR